MLEAGQVDGFRNRATPRCIWVKVVAAVVDRQKPRRPGRIPQSKIGIHDAVEFTAGANPLIECNARSFVRRRVEAGQARIPTHRRDRARLYRHAAFVRPGDELPEAGDQIVLSDVTKYDGASRIRLE